MLNGVPHLPDEFDESFPLGLGPRCFVSRQFGILRLRDHVEPQSELVGIEPESPRTDGIGCELEVVMDGVSR